MHRLLQASIDPDAVYGQELIDKTKMKELCDGKRRVATIQINSDNDLING